MSDNIVLVTGGFDPIHSGHIEYIKDARQMGRVLVGLNSDAWLARKKGRAFMPFAERYQIVNNLKDVMGVIVFDDSDDTACDAIAQVKQNFPNNHIIFANGGDRTSTNIPEMARYDNDPQVSFEFGVGGTNKKNSSSWILKEWKEPKTERSWGYYRVLHDVPGMKVKELTIEPNRTMSMQKHKNRSEYWIVSEGECIAYTNLDKESTVHTELGYHKDMVIPVNSWHQLSNPYDKPCKLVEIQYGTDCSEEDIIRL